MVVCRLLSVVLVLFTTAIAVAQQPAASGEQLLAAMQEKVVRSVARAEKSVVTITSLPREEAAGFAIPNVGRPGAIPPARERVAEVTNASGVCGAGVVVDRRGLVVTAYHVLGNVAEASYQVWLQHRPLRAQLLAADPWFDLAVLRVDQTDLEPIRFGDGSTVTKGQFVVVLGNPQALARDGVPSGSWGIVSNRLRRAPRVPERSSDSSGRESVHHFGTLIQTDAHWDPGYSGGPLLNLEGEMIGLTTAFAGRADEPKGAGLAIPVDEHFHAVLEKLKSGKSPEFGFLGVGPVPLDDRLRSVGRYGAFVETVSSGSPAARAGIRSGDVITHIDGARLYDDDDLFRSVGLMPPERLVRLTVYRGDLFRLQGDVLRLEARLEKRHIAARRVPYATVGAPSWRGMTVDYASVAVHRNRSTLSAMPDSLPSDGCVYVVDVERDSPAWNAGLRAGMFVVQAGEERVRNPREFFAAVTRAPGERLSLQVVARQSTATIHTVAP
jgi:serine protease Do